MNRGLLTALFCLSCTGVAAADASQETPPISPRDVCLYGGDSGRFEVIAKSGEAGLRLASLANEAWAIWRDPLGLPDRLPTGITVRLVSETEWTLPEPWWRVVSEAGGVVTVRIKAGGEAGVTRDDRWLRALAEGALHRQAIYIGVVPERMWIPDWLVAGAAEAALVGNGRPAMMDAWRQAIRGRGRMPALVSLLSWKGGGQLDELDNQRVLASFALWQWLRMESGSTTAWRRLVAALLAGASPRHALNDSYGGRFHAIPGPELELNWQVVSAGLAQEQSIPFMSASDSRRLLDHLDRLVLTKLGTGEERVMRLSEDWAQRGEPAVSSTREQRVNALAANFTRMHPFYRNAAGSLGRVWLAGKNGREREWDAALAEWRADRTAGRELERTSTALLDDPMGVTR